MNRLSPCVGAKNKNLFLTRSFASRFQIRSAQPFKAKSKRTINWSLYSQGLRYVQSRALCEIKRRLKGVDIFGRDENQEPFFTIDIPDEYSDEADQQEQPNMTEMQDLFDYCKGLDWDEEPDFRRIEHFISTTKYKKENAIFLTENSWETVLQVIND